MPTVYTVSESEGTVEVCVTTPDSVILERPITYSIQTIDDSAIGKSPPTPASFNEVAMCSYIAIICGAHSLVPMPSPVYYQLFDAAFHYANIDKVGIGLYRW